MTPRRHAALIHAFADGAKIEFKNEHGKWAALDNPSWIESAEYRIKPFAPAYPETTMTGAELHHVYVTATGCDVDRGLMAVANAALRYAIDTGLVAPKEAYDQVNTALAEAERRLGQCEARELEVAGAVKLACEDYAARGLTLRPVFRIDLPDIIASVP